MPVPVDDPRERLAAAVALHLEAVESARAAAARIATAQGLTPGPGGGAADTYDQEEER